MSDAGATSDFAYDVFVSHASEDKAAFVDDLVRALGERGVRVWYDSFEIALGDDFRRKMEQGLLGSRFAVVVLSPSFVQAGKYWTQAELSALLTSTRSRTKFTTRSVGPSSSGRRAPRPSTTCPCRRSRSSDVAASSTV